MAWWYWFGMWVFGIASVILAWWLFVDAFRQKTSNARLVWPAVAAAGVVMQAPAVALSAAARESSGTFFALLGVSGVVLTAVAAVTHFTGNAPRGHDLGTWAGRTRDVAGTASHSSEGRRRREPARATVPVAEVKGTPSPKSDAAPPTLAAQQIVQPSETDQEMAGAAPNSGARSGDAWDDTAATLSDESAVAEQTLTIDADPTLVEETPQTIVDEPGVEGAALDEGSSLVAELIVTGGTSSRIVVTERTGPFRVGRDPAKTSLAVEDGRVSRVHFIIDRVGDEFVITDAGSANGTFVNGSAVIEPRRLADGDSVEFGRSSALFTLTRKISS